MLPTQTIIENKDEDRKSLEEQNGYHQDCVKKNMWTSSCYYLEFISFLRDCFISEIGTMNNNSKSSYVFNLCPLTTGEPTYY